MCRMLVGLAVAAIAVAAVVACLLNMPVENYHPGAVDAPAVEQPAE